MFQTVKEKFHRSEKGREENSTSDCNNGDLLFPLMRKQYRYLALELVSQLTLSDRNGKGR